jgi:uncharacterized protein with von Willebrand factor type A (vWA) domain
MIIDLPGFAAAFGRAIHRAGLPVTPEHSVRFARALAVAPPTSRSELYWTARTVFVSARGQIEVFDRVFAALFDGFLDPAGAVRGDQNAPPLSERSPAPGLRLPPGPAELGGGLAATGATVTGAEAEAESGEELELPVGAATDAERLGERDFGSLEEEELLALRALMRELALAPPLRRVRRLRRDPHGSRLDVRATLRASYRTGGDPFRRVMRRRVERRRRLVLLCDISGSMEPYTRAFLQLLHAAVGSGARAEAFVFATRLTRLTTSLRGSQPDLAIDRAAAAARDWSSGTRIGEALRRFNDDYGRRGMARGAVVVILSDGWERGDPELVGREMARLRRLAFRIVWVNPRKAARGFEPVAGGMAAALPYCDSFVSGHNLRALTVVAEAIADGSRQVSHFREQGGGAP